MSGFECEFTLEELEKLVDELNLDNVDIGIEDVDSSGTAYIVKDEGKEKVQIVVGNLKEYENSGHCPELVTGRIYEDFVDAFMSGDIGETVKKSYDAFNYTMKLNGPIVTEQTYVLSEKLIEEGMIADPDINGYFRQAIVVNPSSGTLFRMKKVGMDPEVVLLNTCPEDYLSRIKMKLDDVKFSYREVNEFSFDAESFYYFGTGIGDARKYGVKNYFGFEVNPIVLASRGDVVSIKEGEVIDIEYMRRNEKKRLCRKYDCDVNIYAYDYMGKRYKTKHIVHDFVSTFKIKSESFKGCLGSMVHLVGLDAPPDDAIIELCGDKKNIECKEDGDVLWKYQYVRCSMFSSYVDLGKKFYFKIGNGDCVIGGKKCVECPRDDAQFVLYKDSKGVVKYKGESFSVYPKRPVVVSLCDMVNECESFLGVDSFMPGEEDKGLNYLTAKYNGTYYGDLKK